MNEDAIRTMIRQAIAKQRALVGDDEPLRGDPAPQPALASHASHFRYALPGSGEACLIEPTVQCNHCGYCQSHGH